MKPDTCDLLKLQDWFDGRLADTEEATRLTAHVAGCATCREQVEAWRRMRALLAPASRTGVPPEAWEGIQRRLVQAAVTVVPARWWPAAAAAAVAFGLILWRLLVSGPDTASLGWDNISFVQGEARSEWIASQVPLPETASSASAALSSGGTTE